jgi:hypothetical protein
MELLDTALRRAARSESGTASAKTRAYKSSLIGKLDDAFGEGTFTQTGSTSSKSRYLTHVPSGTKIRISDHALPLGYEQPDLDFPIGMSVDEQMAAINDFLKPNEPAGNALGDLGAAKRFKPKRLEKGLTGDPGYVYHATNEDRLQEILASGKLKTHRPGDFTDQDMWPDGAVEKRAYFGGSPEHLYQFAPAEGTPVVLRTKRNQGTFVRENTGDIFTRKQVSAKGIEFLGEDGVWHSLKELTSAEPAMNNALSDIGAAKGRR